MNIQLINIKKNTPKKPQKTKPKKQQSLFRDRQQCGDDAKNTGF